MNFSGDNRVEPAPNYVPNSLLICQPPGKIVTLDPDTEAKLTLKDPRRFMDQDSTKRFWVVCFKALNHKLYGSVVLASDLVGFSAKYPDKNTIPDLPCLPARNWSYRKL